MFILQCVGQREREGRHTTVILGSLLALAVCPAARATTYLTVDGHPNPVTLIEGETVTMRFDVAKAGGTVNFQRIRDLAGTGKYDPAYPLGFSAPIADGGADGGLNRVLKVSPGRIISTVGGTGKAGYSGDGGPALRRRGCRSPSAWQSMPRAT